MICVHDIICVEHNTHEIQYNLMYKHATHIYNTCIQLNYISLGYPQIDHMSKTQTDPKERLRLGPASCPIYGTTTDHLSTR